METSRTYFSNKT
jgi:carboxypeptidase C (cathepsin A)